MSKYTKHQLVTMATVTLQAKENGDDRYLILVLKLAQATGLSTQKVVENIQKLARGEDVK